MQPSDTQLQNLYDEYQAFARQHGWRLNPNKKQLMGVLKMLLLNERTHGIRFCPCKPNSIGVQTNINGETCYVSKCPCVHVAEEIAANGHCCCQLFHA